MLLLQPQVLLIEDTVNGQNENGAKPYTLASRYGILFLNSVYKHTDIIL